MALHGKGCSTPPFCPMENLENGTKVNRVIRIYSLIRKGKPGCSWSPYFLKVIRKSVLGKVFSIKKRWQMFNP
jgi:hypothetical protein